MRQHEWDNTNEIEWSRTNDGEKTSDTDYRLPNNTNEIDVQFVRGYHGVVTRNRTRRGWETLQLMLQIGHLHD